MVYYVISQGSLDQHPITKDIDISALKHVIMTLRTMTLRRKNRP